MIAPAGGFIGKGRSKEVVDRTVLTTRSIEFDAVLVADGTGQQPDIRVVILLQELYRHCKAVGAWGDGVGVLTGAGIPADGPGVLHGDVADKTFAAELIAAVGLHRAWERADVVMANAVAPVV